MARYFGFQVYKGDQGTVDLYVDTDAAKAFRELAKHLNHARRYGHGLETLEVGQVEAGSVDDALNEIRAERWIKGTHGYADGVSPLDEDDDAFDEDRIVRTAVSEGRSRGAKAVLVCPNCASASYFDSTEGYSLVCPSCKHEADDSDVHAI